MDKDNIESAEEKLSGSAGNKTPRKLIDNIQAGICVFQRHDGKIQCIIANRCYACMLGLKADDLIGNTIDCLLKRVHPDDRERCRREIADVIDKLGKASGTFRFYSRAKNEYVFLIMACESVTGTDGNQLVYFTFTNVSSIVTIGGKNELVGRNTILRRLIDYIPASIIVYKVTNGIMSIAAVNRYLSGKKKVTAESLMEMSTEDMISLIFPEDRQEAVSFFQSLFANDNASGEFTYRVIANKSCGYQWYHCSAIKDTQKDGSSLIYAVYTDATYQKVKEEDFNRIIRELIATGPNSLCTFRLNLTRNICVDGHGASDYVRKLRGSHTADELLEKVASMVNDERDADKFRRKYNRLELLESFRHGDKCLSATYRCLTDKGELHWTTTFFHILQNPYTEDIEAIAYSADSDRHRKKEEIIAAVTGEEYDYIGLVDVTTGQVSFYYLSDRNALSKNTIPSTYDQTTGLLSEHMLSEEGRQHYLMSVSLPNVIEKLTDKPVYRYAYSCRNDRGERLRKQVKFRYIESDRREIMFSRSDVTATFEHEEAYAAQLRMALLDAEKANEMKTDFLGNVSHDMRTPLNAILGYGSLALAADGVKEKDDFLRKIGVAGNILLSLINDTLDLQKIENGAVTLKPEPINMNVMINDVVASVRPLMDKKHINFTIDSVKAGIDTVNADAVRMRQILINLLSNAVKFTPDGGKVGLGIECCAVENGRVREKIVVRDNGIGMTREFQEKIFEPFAQERTKETAHIGGSGLGMTITKRLVDIMGGRIEAESKLGQGTVFTVYLDFEQADEKTPDTVRTCIKAADISGMNILLCEDNAMNLEIAKRILVMNHASVVTARDGKEGYQKFVASQPDDFDIILMDIRMPNMDGYTATKKIRSSGHPRAQTIPIMAMSADAYASDVDKSIASGMNGHISKPIDPSKMISEIARLTDEEKR